MQNRGILYNHIMQNFLQQAVVILTGFSLVSSVILVFSHLGCDQYRDKLFSRIAGVVLLLGLFILQVVHFLYLMGNDVYILSRPYIIALFLVSPAFYFFSREVLKVENQFHPVQLLHLLPLLISFFIPPEYAQLLAFFIGTFYVLWLAKSVYSLRAQRSRFKFELLALAAMFIVAVLVLILGILLPVIDEKLFYTSYAASLGLGLAIVIFTLLRFPDVTEEIAEAAKQTYSTSTLNNLDSDALVLKLRQLLEVDKLFTQDSLNLSALADQLEINSHQLSELINTKFDKSFSQLVREYRITEAKRLLIDEPDASVLSIGLSTGFTSQSNFYSAFKEITGMAPGNYRKSQKNTD